ncbi:MAG: hypothetical protein IT423_11870 [Pirellulaceae bacterium]|nr:hypothetical protein [Pirellulaceae bacterium]
MTMRGKTDIVEAIEYGHIVVKNKTPNRDFSETGRMPIALHFAAAPPPKLELDAQRWVPGERYDAFRARVTNLGQNHATLDAQLTIENETGQRLQVPAGFGRWILPGQELELEFRPDVPLAPGTYRLTTELQNGQNPIIKTQEFVVTDVAQR